MSCQSHEQKGIHKNIEAVTLDPYNGSNMAEKRPVNPPRRTAIAWCIITLASIFGIFNTVLFGIDGFDGGFALAFVSIFVFIMGIIIMVIYFRRARALDKMIKGENLLAHWTYSANEWRAYAEREHREQVETNRAMFITISVIAVIVGVIFVIAVPDSLMSTLISMGGLIIIIGFTAVFVTWYRRSQNQKYIGEVYINRDGAYINRELHTWTGLGARLENASMDDKHLGQAIMSFGYSAPGRYNRYFYNARVPVPLGREKEAKEVLDKVIKSHLNVAGASTI